MPCWCPANSLYKGLLILILVFIALEYLFGSISEPKRWESTVPLNATKIPDFERKNHLFHSPLLSLLLNNKNTTNSNSTIPNNNATRNASSPVYSNVTLLEGSYNASVSPVLPATDVELAFNSSKHNNTTTLPICPEIVPNLQGRIDVIKSPVPTIQQLEKRFSWLKPGGHWNPDSCKAQQKIAIIVPFRNRGEHLLLFMQHMHPFLKRQQIDYRIFIVEQDGSGAFNRAILMNVGYKEALKIDDFDCFIFHDIDLLPEDDRNLYTCPVQPRHMSVAVDIFKYKLPYPSIFGGVSAISREHFQLLNGFSNSFWGWGGEDDDMSNRIRYHNLHISRYPITIARYTMLTHTKDKPSPNRYEILKAGRTRYNTDGLNSVRYAIKQIKENLLYTWLLVDVDNPS